MRKLIFIDTGVLGFAAHPRSNSESVEIVRWLVARLKDNARVCVAEVCDYELRRECVRRVKAKEANAEDSLAALNAIYEKLEYVPITTPAIKRAAELWADARNKSRPTADEKALDCDAIHGGQALVSVGADDDLVIATYDTRDLNTYVPAKQWRDIT